MINDTTQRNYSKSRQKPIIRKWRRGSTYDSSIHLIDQLDENDYNYVKHVKVNFLQLDELPAYIYRFTNLRILEANHNRIRTISPEIGKLKKFKTLVLNNNRLEDLPPQFAGLINLEELILSNNYFYIFPEVIIQLKNLKRLWLINNRLKDLPSGIVRNTNLKKIYLKRNSLDSPLDDIVKAGLNPLIYFENIEQAASIKKLANPRNIKVKRLTLHDIGVFNELSIEFNSTVTGLIGVNGTGKTTILRALALALVGYEPKYDDDRISDLIKIKGLDTAKHVEKKKGTIWLEYTVDGVEVKSVLHFNDDTDVICLTPNTFTFKEQDDYELQLPILGFLQSRGTHRKIVRNEQFFGKPTMHELLPLIRNESTNNLDDLEQWIINLYAEGNRKIATVLTSEPKQIGIREHQIIETVFQIISEIISENVEFFDVLNNQEVWVKTQFNPEGIPLSLLSIGFQDTVGWIGYFMFRMANAYPDIADFMAMPAICMVDELDTYMHPRWQRSVVDVLLKYFVNTQFIIATHSPYVAQSIKSLVALTLEKGKVVVHHVTTEELSYQAIAREIFTITSPFGVDIERKLNWFRQLRIEASNGNKVAEKELITLYDELVTSGTEVEGVIRREYEQYKRLFVK